MIRRIVLCTMVCLGLLLGSAVAGPVFERHYGDAARRAGKAVESDFPEGYRPALRHEPVTGKRTGEGVLEYSVSPWSATEGASGAIVVRVKREARGDGHSGWMGGQGTLFSLMDASRRYVLTASVTWGDEVPGWFAGAGIGAIELSSDVVPPSVWGGWIPFHRRVDVGEWVTFAFTWDHGVNKVYLDGVPLPDRYEAGWNHGSRIAGTGDLSRYLRTVRFLRIGADSEAENSPLAFGRIGGVEVYDTALAIVPPKPLISSVSDDSFRVAGISGKLVAGNNVTVTLVAAPGGRAFFDMGKVKGIPMQEVSPLPSGPGNPAMDNGTYRGSYTVLPGDDFEGGRIVGHFVSSDNVAADPVVSASTWTIDTKPVVAFSIDRKDLPADSTSRARIKIIAKDANGLPLKGRHLKLTLATTDEYTGTVGAGDFGKDVGATVETRWKGETDSWGEVQFDYTSGFAAKTVILTAKDLDSGGVAVDYITAFKEASIDIALTPPVNRAAARRSMQYILKMEASRTELTADGRSRSVIRAKLLDPNGNAVAGDPVVFSLSSANGMLRTITGTTDPTGTAVSEYTAGKRIGIVVVTATATLRNASGNVSITLTADAPAKIYLKAKPQTLPADGISRADLSVKVTDINENPNSDTKVEFRVERGGGKVEYAERTTDRFGDAANRYTSGTTPGIATVTAKVRSKVPTEAELLRARNVLFAPYSPDAEEIRVEKWLKRKGETVRTGEGILEYTIGRSRDIHVLAAPFDLAITEILVEYWDRAEVGETLAIVTPAGK